MGRIQKSDTMPDGAIPVLNHGFVAVEDHLGSDATIVNSARVSFGKRIKKFDAEKDSGLVRFLAQHNHISPFRHGVVQLHIKFPECVARQWYKHCYSPDTEVLTAEGWKYWPDVTAQDELANVTECGEYYFAKPKSILNQHYCGNMVHFDGARTNLLVTDKHRMYVRKRGEDQFTIRTADECLRGEYQMPTLPLLKMPDGSSSDYDRGFLYGFSLAEANFTATKNRMYFVVKNDREKEVIESLRGKHPTLDWREHDGQRDGYIKWSCLKPSPVYNGVASEKSVDYDYLGESRQAYNGFIDGFWSGDGTGGHGVSLRITTASLKLVSDIEEMSLKLGRTIKSTVCHGTDSFGDPTTFYIVTLRGRKHGTLQRTSRRLVPYTGPVYCAEVDTGLLLVRRNGIISVCGNCVGCEWTSGELRFTDHAWNEISGRYIKYGEEFYIPAEFRAQSSDNKQASVDGDIGDSPVSYDFNLLMGDADTRVTYDGTIRDVYNNTLAHVYAAYSALIDAGLSKEQARCLLPVSFYTEVYWTASLQALAHFVKLRDHACAQSEIRQYADAVRELVEPLFPVSWSALMENL